MVPVWPPGPTAGQRSCFHVFESRAREKQVVEVPLQEMELGKNCDDGGVVCLQNTNPCFTNPCALSTVSLYLSEEFISKFCTKDTLVVLLKFQWARSQLPEK